MQVYFYALEYPPAFQVSRPVLPYDVTVHRFPDIVARNGRVARERSRSFADAPRWFRATTKHPLVLRAKRVAPNDESWPVTLHIVSPLPEGHLA